VLPHQFRIWVKITDMDRHMIKILFGVSPVTMTLLFAIGGPASIKCSSAIISSWQ